MAPQISLRRPRREAAAAAAMDPNPLLLLLLLLLLSFLCIITTAAASTAPTSGLLSCLVSANVLNFTVASSSPTSSNYYDLLNSSIRNLRFTGPTIPKPVAIVLPSTKYHLQSTILCCRRSSLAIRIRSGGHSYEGLSYTGDQNNPFVVIDLMNLKRVRVNLTSSTAWVESGATLGEIYYSVATESGGSLAFPAGSCSTVGSGGHIAGGGFGLLSRKYGLAADNVVDAVLIDPVGRVLDRVGMGEDVFWAIRGGGGGSWGAIYAWKLRLVPIPDQLTVFFLRRPGPSRLVAELVHKWQYVAPGLPGNFYLSVTVDPIENGTVAATFMGQFLGLSSLAISLLTQRFPELGLTQSDCVEMSWIQSVVRFAWLTSIADLKVRKSSTGYFKAKSDYCRSPISLIDLVGAFDLLSKQSKAYIILDPYGGAMDNISSSNLPFPHRQGNLYGIQYIIHWTEGDDGYEAWLQGFYEYMAPFVSTNPRAAYVNYVDLDLGTIDWTGGSNGLRNAVGEARVWGEKYFLGNYDRLVRAKTAIDPNNVFRNAQSIPPSSKL